MREPRGLQLVQRHRSLGAAGVVPDTEANVRIFVDVAGDTQRLPGVARVCREELDELPPQRRRAPGAEAEPLLDVAPAVRAGLHSS